ncbi:hypothetical protein C9J48_18755 [Photobacterium profundum]|uniref:Chitinase n=1 Tax=Photobacterium profundum 3TCK TaxID=314280 RepID=Q1Z8I2_9GAMM|nr:Ig-like domain-containing protein [Photobacterium profundum]EAS45126.1 Chitinase [Photobacterium profundum 3TCK]PSV60521.1 hypothetical protein C9J48_18755 [Photobacterium profundum]
MNYKWKPFGIAMLCAGFAMSPLASAIANEFNTDINATSESQSWSSYQIQLVNSASKTIDLTDAVVQFVLPQAVNNVNWTSNALSYPTLTTTHEPDSNGIKHNVSILFPSGSWVDTQLEPGESFTLTVAFGGQVSDMAAFENSVKVITEGTGLPEISIDIQSPVSGAELLTGDTVLIQANVSGEGAANIAFWVNSEEIGKQPITDDTESYQHTWTPSEIGLTNIFVMAFDDSGVKLEEQQVQVNVTSSSTSPNPPVIEFITPTNGSTHKQTDVINISANVTDQDDDLASVTFFANEKKICDFDANVVSDFACDWQPEAAGSAELRIEAKDAENHTANQNIQVTITASGSSCGDVPQYKDGESYQVGDEVTNIGEIFSCKVAGWCGNPVWAPGTGHPDYPDAWKDAWDETGECDVNPTPNVDVLSPQAGDRIVPNQTFNVVVEATDDTAVTRVEAHLNGNKVATTTEPSEGNEYTLVVPGQPEGQYLLTAVAYDDQNAHSETAPVAIAVTDKELVVSLTSPADGSEFYEGRSVKLTADAESFDGTITQVVFYSDGIALNTDVDAPYEYDWVGAQVGNYQIYAKATNSQNQEQQSATSNIEIKEKSMGNDLGNNPDRSISYLTSWGLDDPKALQASNGDGYLLSFGQWDAGGNVSISDNMVAVPEYNEDWMAGNYLAWTQLNFDRPETSMLVAFGGQTYESIWSYLDTPQRREAIATSLVELLHTPFPVYKKGLKPEEVVGECLAEDWSGNCDYNKYQLAGYVQIDGLDFDFEKAARITEAENQNLELLIDIIRQEIGDEKLLSLTTYHVGADPLECQNASVYENCSYIEPARSSHHGEVISLLQSTKDKFDFFNVMTYDAGENFLYDVAMANYAQYIGDKSKVVLGNTINSQWGPNGNFVESRAKNIARAQWQKEQGYGGFFIWALGSNNQSLSMTEQVAYFNEMIDVNK